MLNKKGLAIHKDFKLPDRNKICPCGSGIKFKKCHGRYNHQYLGHLHKKNIEEKS
jgi:hypothetical protein